MKIKTADLIGPALDWLVAKLLGQIRGDITHPAFCKRWREEVRTPAIYPSTAGDTVIEIMEREKIRVEPWPDKDRVWAARAYKFQGWANPTSKFVFGPTLRIAVCRCYVASKLGDEVDVPEELLSQQPTNKETMK